ncbi:acylneuraminate cytidylyltransferase family protein [Anaeromicropila herbilytica]|uniref:N-acylneuraminate cytidylyltransferase n=1 Tax=Anaeromicropila herbilytica TaxID=2785025 RepID=A0A7R7EP87_9FIRM|nr:acylneuraminate cytidylyltransferase family protein [Anaeromicropila herbilytica]BCN32516.1 hypothetical protein bsdtb5_38110 [Anaeromicropila herbilytica]
MKILFLLPARSGSKGVKDKNIKKLAGKPLMAYSIEAIKTSEAYKNGKARILLSTESEEYAVIGRKLGAEVPFLRPKELAEDNSKIIDTLKNIMNQYKIQNEKFDMLAMIQITSPFITGDDIDQAIQLLSQSEDVDSVISVTKAETIPLWCNVLDKSLKMDDFIEESIKRKNRQELPDYYKITGAIRATKWNHFIQNNYDWYKNSVAFIMEQSHSIDIDTQLEFEYAEFLMERRM